jgi:hypothetical protein
MGWLTFGVALFLASALLVAAEKLDNKIDTNKVQRKGASPQEKIIRVPLRAANRNIANPKGHITIIDEETPDPSAVHLEGGVRRKLFIYDDTPLDGLTSNHAVWLDLMDHDIVMRSVTTRGRWDSARMGDIPISYHGEPVGFINVDSTPELKQAAQLKHMQLKAVWPGGIVSNVMRMVALMPSQKRIKEISASVLQESNETQQEDNQH